MKKIILFLLLLLMYPMILCAGIIIIGFEFGYCLGKWLDKVSIKDDIKDAKENAFETILYPICLYKRIFTKK